MIFAELIAEDISQVGLAWFDFFSIGHICMGVGIFLVLSLFYTIPMSKEDGESQVKLPLWGVWILTLLIAVLWEVLENMVFIEIGWKFEGRIDSTENIITDIILVGLGGLGTWLFAHLIFENHKKVWPYYLFGIIGLLLWIGLFIILRAYTYNHNLFDIY